ncbi:dihydrolipoyl dehydrogenase [Clostridioides mangenotii]|uniref:dihydrolipoyl dehydrogenase n=1 Tax=Metaclostridioides mangenotii TaxID=1540 RepID=UPI001C128F08|nr:dihydrolipoyl dehydrogenase [Clostridioides mangenotii]MBU5307323.1 dihydrolipoyl dehydrogenase [Clostridioides mangenotii]
MNIVIIGGGPGGYVAALKASMFDVEVTVIENYKVGGTCLNFGCIPTKSLLASANVLNTVLGAKDFGINIDGNISIDYQTVISRKDKVVDQLVKGVEFLLEKRKVELINGYGKLIDRNTVEVTKKDGTVDKIKADKIILANGSKPVIPDIFPYDGKVVITSDDVLSLKDLPQSMLVVGGGVIGCEIGQFFRSMGTEVTIVEMADQLLINEDKDIVKQLVRQFKKDKIKMITGTSVVSCKVEEGKAVVELSDGKKIETQYVLVCVGRKANIDGSGIEDIGIETKKGKVLVDKYLQTSTEGIYAVGDIIDTPFLAHVASKEGEVAVENALGRTRELNYTAIPRCVYTEPEVASVGKTEKDLNSEEIPYRVGKFEFRGLGKAQTIGKFQGFVKVIVGEDNRILGASIIGASATELLTELTLAVHLGLTVQQVGDVIHPHPSLSEGLIEALNDVNGEAIHSVGK